MYTLWHNYQYIESISCKSHQNLFWKIFEGGNKISSWYIGHDQKTLQKIINIFEKKTCSVNNNNNNSNTDKKQTITFPWIPKTGPKIKKEIQKFGWKVVFQKGPNLKNFLCKNKNQLIPNSWPVAYELICSCVYNGETKKKIISRSIEYQQKSIKGNCSSSGTTEHTKEWHGHFDWNWHGGSQVWTRWHIEHRQWELC